MHLPTIRKIQFGVLFALQLVVSSFDGGGLFAQQKKTEKWTMAVRHDPPLMIQHPGNRWTGIGIELWQQVADELNITTEWRDGSRDQSIQWLTDGKVDAMMSTIPKTDSPAEFTHPIFSIGFGIATRTPNASIWDGFAALFSIHILVVIGVLIAILLLVGSIVWMFEKKSNAEQFGGGGKGIGSGFWWAAVTMTTVGYGDKSPTSAAGRSIALVWMFVSLFLISAFTATITTALHHSQDEPAIHSVSDLRRHSVGCVNDSEASAFLDQKGVSYRPFSTVNQAVQALSQGDIDAIFFDEPVLRYWINQRTKSPQLQVRSTTSNPRPFVFGLPGDSEMRSLVNRILLEKLDQPQWQSRLERFLGD